MGKSPHSVLELLNVKVDLEREIGSWSSTAPDVAWRSTGSRASAWPTQGTGGTDSRAARGAGGLSTGARTFGPLLIDCGGSDAPGGAHRDVAGAARLTAHSFEGPPSEPPQATPSNPLS